MPSTTVNTAVLPSIAISSCTLTNTVKDLIIRAQVRDTGLLDDPFDKKAKEKGLLFVSFSIKIKKAL